MTVVPEDELVHPRGEGSTWQENYLFIGASADSDVAFAVHVARLHEIGSYDVKLCVAVEDQICSYTQHLPIPAGLAAPGAVLDCKEPLRLWHITLSGSGRMSEEGELVCTSGGEVPVSVDVAFTATVDPIDQSAGFERMDSAGAGSSGHHYNQGGRWTGLLTIGDLKLEGEGPAIRDHTWGERHVGAMDYCWWTPMIFDDGTELAGIDMRTAEGSRTSFAFSRCGDGQESHAALDVDIVAGDPSDYTKAVVRFGDEYRVEASRFRRLPIAYLRGGGVGWVSDDALCQLSDGQGRTGFGVVERNRLVTETEAARSH